MRPTCCSPYRAALAFRSKCSGLHQNFFLYDRFMFCKKALAPVVDLAEIHPVPKDVGEWSVREMNISEDAAASQRSCSGPHPV